MTLDGFPTTADLLQSLRGRGDDPFELRLGNFGRRVNHDQQFGRSTGVTIVRAESEVGFPNAPRIIRDGDPPADIHLILADARVRLALPAKPHRHCAVIFDAS